LVAIFLDKLGKLDAPKLLSKTMRSIHVVASSIEKYLIMLAVFVFTWTPTYIR